MSKINHGVPLIELDAVTKTYPGPINGFVALHEVTLSLAAGALSAIVGRSGSGKSTLINLMAGIDRADRGRVTVAGQELRTLDESQLARWRGRNVGVVFQFFQLLPSLTILENVMLPMDFCATYAPAQARRRAEELLSRVGIAEQAHKLPAALSGGQQQRAAIARALANDPPLIIADEPTGNLDSRTAASIMALLVELTRAGKTVVLVTHERDVAALADCIVTLADGKVVRCEDVSAAEGRLRAAGA